LKTKRISRIETFMPEYLKLDTVIKSVVMKSKEQQQLEFAMFREKVRAVAPKAVKRKTI
jgi:hypothetical protein